MDEEMKTCEVPGQEAVVLSFCCKNFYTCRRWCISRVAHCSQPLEDASPVERSAHLVNIFNLPIASFWNTFLDTYHFSFLIHSSLNLYNFFSTTPYLTLFYMIKLSTSTTALVIARASCRLFVFHKQIRNR
ncbi:unnamed protein product [Amoebophrya sp. A120]|nr:unnamed protein product [Amoebophrya sp. A120]|eukprot:GSA120T00013376001.1